MRSLFRFLAMWSTFCVAAASAQVAVISGQAINQYGQPLPFAQVRICSVTATLDPSGNCTPTQPIYLDYSLTQPAGNPYTSDQYGNYVVYAGALAPPNLYEVQLFPGTGITWSYVVNGPFCAITICVPSGPNGSAQYDNNGVFGGVSAQLYAGAFSGSDIGAQINAAFLSASGTSGTPATGVVVNLAPNGAYTYATDWGIPNNVSSPYITSPVLDCHGSTLTYTGSGEGWHVLGENAYKSGEIRNCNIAFSNPAATATMWSRIDFKMTHNQFSLGTTGITMTNDTVHGGPGYTEDQHWSDIQVTVPASSCGITLNTAATGASSFLYNWMEGFHWDLGTSSNGLCLSAGGAGPIPTIFGGNYQFHVNSSGAGSKVIDLAQSTNISRGTVDISGENTGGGTQYDVFAEGTASTFQNWGKSYATGFIHGYGAGVPASNITWMSGPAPIDNDLTGGAAEFGVKTIFNEPGSVNAARQCANETFGGGTAFLLASNGGVENDCYFIVGWRSTSNTFPDVDLASTSGNAIQSIFFIPANPASIGIGPGFSQAPNVISGTDISKPQSTAEVRGVLSVRDPQATGTTLANNGATFSRDIDHATGNALDYLVSGVAGQPTNHYKLQFYGYGGGGPVVTAEDCNVDASNNPNCTFQNAVAALSLQLSYLSNSTNPLCYLSSTATNVGCATGFARLASANIFTAAQTAPQWVDSGTTPTGIYGTASGHSGAMGGGTIIGTQTDGEITFTTGASPATGTVATITLPLAYTHASYCQITRGANDTATGAILVNSGMTDTFSPTAASAYGATTLVDLFYHCGGY